MLDWHLHDNRVSHFFPENVEPGLFEFIGCNIWVKSAAQTKSDFQLY